ncbi:hypothetical protein ABLB69_00455 [Xenorhabdus khoisanae]|uniref:hypothetical protein n=1 Tax=Xenorhabdus khoisanae TaxID=880157 RepID=UPI00128DB23D|nr:hypothetical protein [Xenorhabdus khoisanae]
MSSTMEAYLASIGYIAEWTASPPSGYASRYAGTAGHPLNVKTFGVLTLEVSRSDSRLSPP